MDRPRVDVRTLPWALLVSSLAPAQDPPEGARPAPAMPAMGCPVAPILARVEQPGTITHKVALPGGEWLVRFASYGCRPVSLASGPFTLVVTELW